MWSGISGAPPPTTQWGAAGAQQPAQQQQQQQTQQQKHDIFVGNLAFSTTEEHLHQAFSEIGRIIKVRMVTDLETHKPRGFAFIEFEDPQAALSAIRNMNDYELNGRRIRVNFSNSSHLETLAGKLGMDMTQHSQAKKSSSGVIVGAGGVGSNISTDLNNNISADSANINSSNETGTQAVANALKSMSKGEMYDVIKNLKEIADNDPDEARKLISGHSLLPEAILFLMGKLDMIKTPVGTDISATTALTPSVVPQPHPLVGGLVPPPDAPPPLGVAPARTDPRGASKPATATATPAAAASVSSALGASRPADPRAKSVDPRAALQQAQQQVQPQNQQQKPSLPPPMPPHHIGGQVPPPSLAPPPRPPFGMAVPPLNTTTATATATTSQQPQPPPGGMGVAGLDPSLVQEVMSLTPQQIAQLPPDKQQGILALRQQITNSM